MTDGERVVVGRVSVVSKLSAVVMVWLPAVRIAGPE